MFCPYCGDDLSRDFKNARWVGITSNSPLRATVFCSNCKIEIAVEDRTDELQEDLIEMVLR